MARYKKYTIKQGDTLQSIAHKVTGNVSDWIAIAEYNNLKYPYIVSDDFMKLQDIEHLVVWGDQLIIPFEADLLDTDVNKLNRRDQDYIINLTFGRDLNMTSDEKYYNRYGTSDELLGLTHNYAGDVSTVQGIENLKQALTAKLLTRKGSLLLHPEYGSKLHELFGKADEVTMKLIEIEVCRVVQTDSRVSNCVLDSAEVNGDEYTGKFLVEIRSLRESFELLVQGDSEGQIVVVDKEE